MKKNKSTIAITGGAGRIGSAIAHDLIQKGYNVLLGDVNKKELTKIQKALKSKSLQIYSGDLTSAKNIDNFINFGVKKFNSIDAAVHCSYPKSKKWGTKFESLQEKYLNYDIQKQLGGTIIFAQKITKYFLKNKRGNLVLVSSIQGISPPKFEHYKNLKMSSPIEYSAIKAGVISIGKYLAKYFKGKNIRVNIVSPGGIKDNQPAKFIKRYKKSCNSKGLLDGSDVSKLISFLLSNESKYITGQNLIIDDGWSL